MNNVLALLNEQVNAEFFAAFLYLRMSDYFTDENLNGFAKWSYLQYEEEIEHALKIREYIHDRGWKVDFKSILTCSSKWSSAEEVFTQALNHEKSVTKSINNIMEAAYVSKDFATVEFLNWFVKEQVEEENTASLILQQIKLIKNDNVGLLFLDKELSARKS